MVTEKDTAATLREMLRSCCDVLKLSLRTTIVSDRRNNMHYKHKACRKGVVVLAQTTQQNGQLENSKPMGTAQQLGQKIQ